MSTSDFYDQLASLYHLIFTDWEHAIQVSAEGLDKIIKDSCLNSAKTVLDISCGIGTQALGLAGLGYKVTGSDLSPGAIQRARLEAGKRGLGIDFSVADMRAAYAHHQRQFDVLISYHNSVTHLSTESEILTTFGQFFDCLHPGGICVINVRDYDNEERGVGMLKPHGVRVEKGTRYIVFQVWDFNEDVCDASLYFVADKDGRECQTHAFKTRYYATGIDDLMHLLSEAQFQNVHRIDSPFEGPIIVAVRPLRVK